MKLAPDEDKIIMVISWIQFALFYGVGVAICVYVFVRDVIL